jgi:hypothetical protein
MPLDIDDRIDVLEKSWLKYKKFLLGILVTCDDTAIRAGSRTGRCDHNLAHAET